MSRAISATSPAVNSMRPPFEYIFESFFTRGVGQGRLLGGGGGGGGVDSGRLGSDSTFGIK